MTAGEWSGVDRSAAGSARGGWKRERERPENHLRERRSTARMTAVQLADFSPAPNQGGDPALYEIENRALDPEGLVLDAMRRSAPWAGRTLIDLGCGSGFWLPIYAAEAAHVIGVEPDERLLPLARARGAARAADARTTSAAPTSTESASTSAPQIQVLHGSAEHIPLPDASADVVHARFAYFFPPNCDAGLAEVMRVLKPGGALVVIDNDLRSGQFAELLRTSLPAEAQGGGQKTDDWWAARGAERTEVMSEWRFERRSDFESVLRLEFPADVADAWLTTHPGALGLSYGYVLFTVRR
jgi:SAM-dependent methyltransferase